MRFYDPTQAFANRCRRLRRGLPDVDLPLGIEGIGNVDAHTGKLRELELAGESKPGSVNDEAPIAIKVEPLVAHIALRSSIFFPVVRRDLVVMREGYGPYSDLGAVETNHFLLVVLSRGMV